MAGSATLALLAVSFAGAATPLRALTHAVYEDVAEAPEMSTVSRI
jgi:hypothetical protein